MSTITQKAKAKFLSTTRSLSTLFNQVGLLFNGNRNTYQVYGYENNPTFIRCWQKYVRQDIAGRIVDTPADAIWTKPPIFTGAQNVVSTIDDLVKRLSLWPIMSRADKLAGIGSYSTILIGIDDGKTLNTPVVPSKRNKVLYLQPYSCDRMYITSYVTDPNDPRFGKPATYALKPGSTNMTASTVMGQVAAAMNMTEAAVHWSRVVHISEGLLEDDTFGIPRLVRCYNLLDDMLKIAGGSAEMFWLNARGGLHIDIDKDMSLDEDDETALSDEVTDYSDNLQRVIRTRGVKVSPITMQVADPRQTFEVTLNLIAGTTGIPQRILLGAEAGQLASEQDRANWAQRIDERRRQFAEPNAIRPLLNCLAGMGLFTPEDILATTIAWPEAFVLNPLERSQTSAQQARSAANLAKAMTTLPDLLSLPEAQSIIRLAAPVQQEDTQGGDTPT